MTDDNIEIPQLDEPRPQTIIGMYGGERWSVMETRDAVHEAVSEAEPEALVEFEAYQEGMANNTISLRAGLIQTIFEITEERYAQDAQDRMEALAAQAEMARRAKQGGSPLL